MQNELRYEVLRTLYHAEPVSEDQMNQTMETDLTLAARGSVENANQIVDNQSEFNEKDFKSSNSKPVKKRTNTIKKARKNERKRKPLAPFFNCVSSFFNRF